MAGQPITKPSAVTFPLEDILGEVLEGRVRIPDFQREFRWQWEDLRRLPAYDLATGKFVRQAKQEATWSLCRSYGISNVEPEEEHDGVYG